MLRKKKINSTFLSSSKLNSVELLKLKLLLSIVLVGTDVDYLVLGYFCVVSLTLRCSTSCVSRTVFLVWTFAI